MFLKKLVLALAALLTLSAAYLRPVYSLSAGGVPIDGEWSAWEILRSRRAAEAAALELTDAAVPETEGRLRLALREPRAGSGALARELLALTPGVERGWDVSVDGVDVGRTGDPSALGEALLAAIAEAAPPESLRTGFDSELELREVFAPAGHLDDTMDISARVRSLTRVVYTLPGGETRYA